MTERKVLTHWLRKKQKDYLSLFRLLEHKYYGLGDFKDKHLFPTVLKAGKPKITVLADWVSSEKPLPGSSRAIFSLCPHLVEGARELWALFEKGTNPIHKGSIFIIQSLPKGSTTSFQPSGN